MLHMSFTLDLSHHLTEVQPISTSRGSRQTLDAPLSPAERSQFAVWLVNGDMSIVQSKMPDGTGQQLLELNKVLAKARKCSLTPLRIHTHKNLVYVTWSD